MEFSLISKASILYLSYTGMLEPLGRSQVLAYLSRLSDEYRYILVSFEKPGDMANKEAVDAMHEECKRYDITWKPQTYHQHPRMLATIWDLLVLLWLTLRFSMRKDIRLVHCRSYIPTIAAWLCGKVTRQPFIFDMRALWPDEMVSAQRLRKKSLTYKALKKVEGALIRDAGAVVSLTQAAVDHLVELYPSVDKKKFFVITTCVDLSRFEMEEQNPSCTSESFTVGVMGTVLSGWFKLDWLFKYFLHLKEINPNVVLEFLTKDDHQVIALEAAKSGISGNDIILNSCQPHEVPNYIKNFNVSVMFFTADIGKLGSAPTRMGELLAAGIPVVGNRGVGDMASLIERYKVGVAVDSGSDKNLRNAAQELVRFLESSMLKKACRSAAESYFSADKGAEKYRQVYQGI